jgi:hypothetical protein
MRRSFQPIKLSLGDMRPTLKMIGTIFASSIFYPPKMMWSGQLWKDKKIKRWFITLLPYFYSLIFITLLFNILFNSMFSLLNLGKSTHTSLKLPPNCQCTFQITNCVNISQKTIKQCQYATTMTKIPFIKL